MPVVRIQIPGQLAYRELATRTVALVCKVATGEADLENDMGTSFTHEMVSAVGEAFNNIVLHAYEGSEQGDVTLVITHSPASVKVELIDTGISFDISNVEQPDLEQLPESGMGLYIMRSFVDSLEYSSGATNVLAMTKFLNGSSPTLSERFGS